MEPPRPTVSVVVPFLGSDDDFRRVIAGLEALSTAPGDELIVADNRWTGMAGPEPESAADRVIIHPAGGVRSPGFARNRGAARAGGEWLVFIDADTQPEPGLLEAYFEPRPLPTTAVLGGGIRDVLPDGPATVSARRIVARGQMDDRTTLQRHEFPYAQTANCAIRREAFVAVGGFEESVRAGEDADLCLRLYEHGWHLERRPEARVAHVARATLGDALRQLARHGAGAAWCNRRHPGSFPAPGPLALAARIGGSGARAARQAARGDREAAAQAALEILEASAFEFGRLLSNRAPR